MSDAVAIQLIMSAAALAIALVTAYVTIRLHRSVGQVQTTVNGTHTELTHKIKLLEDEIRQLNADPDKGSTPVTFTGVTLADDGSGSVTTVEKPKED